jgi:hypothetical protein
MSGSSRDTPTSADPFPARVVLVGDNVTQLAADVGEVVVEGSGNIVNVTSSASPVVDRGRRNEVVQP